MRASETRERISISFGACSLACGRGRCSRVLARRGRRGAVRRRLLRQAVRIRRGSRRSTRRLGRRSSSTRRSRRWSRCAACDLDRPRRAARSRPDPRAVSSRRSPRSRASAGRGAATAAASCRSASRSPTSARCSEARAVRVVASTQFGRRGRRSTCSRRPSVPRRCKPGTLKNYGWDGSEIVAFRLHLPSRDHLPQRARPRHQRDRPGAAAATSSRGNSISPIASTAGRSTIDVEMESQSILYRTLWLFAGAFARRGPRPRRR